MKKTWKCWLGAIAASLYAAGPVWSQLPPSSESSYYAQFPGAQNPPAGSEGSVRLGRGSSSGSISETGPIQRVQNLADPEMIFDNAPPFVEDAFLPGDDTVGFARTTSPAEIYWRVGNTAFDRLGIENGYTNLNAFVPISIESDNALWFANPRVYVTDSGDVAGSVGLGRRIYNANDDRVYGASFWWDWDQPYHQLGGSFESIGRYFTLRSNFSLPIGDANTNRGVISNFANPTFSGSTIVYQQTTLIENAYQNFDFEAAMPMPLVGQYGIDVGVGGYYLNGDGDARDGAGFSVRTQAQVTKDFWINGLLTTDPVFGANYSMNMELTLPDGSGTQWFAQAPVASHLTSSVLRNYRVARKTTAQTAERAFTSPKGTRPLGVAIIDPNAAVAGTGTATSPFMSVADYMALPAVDRADFDIVFVRANTDGSDTNLNTTVTLLDCQQLLGDGGGNVMFQSLEGNFLLPGQTIGNSPLLTNSGAVGMNVVTLANSNQVAGFTIDAGNTANGIVGTAIDGFNINNNTFQNVVNGVVITSNTTPALGYPGENQGFIRNNTLVGEATSINGISITHTAGPMRTDITGNNVTGFTGGTGIILNATGGTITANDALNNASISGNVTSGNGSGMRISGSGGARLDLSVNGNTANDNTDAAGAGIAILASNAIYNINSYAGNTASGNAGDGALISGSLGSNININDGVDDTSSLTGNTFSGNGIDGLRIQSNNSNVLIDQIAANTFGAVGDGNGDDGLELRTTNGGNITVLNPLAFNTFTGNGDNGLEMLANTGTINALIGDATVPTNINSFSNNLGNGFTIGTTTGGVVNTGLNNVQANNNLGSGGVFNLNGGTVNLTNISTNTFTGNGLDGLQIINSQGGLFSAPLIDNNDFSNNTRSGMFIGGTGAAPGVARAVTNLGQVELNNFNRDVSGTMGIQFNSIDVLTTGTLRQNTFVGRAGAAQGIGGEVSGTAGVIPQGGVFLDLAAATVAEANTFAANGDAHIGLIMSGNTVNQITVANHDLSGAVDIAGTVNFQGEGIGYVLRDTALLTGFVQSSTLNNNAGEGIAIDVTGNNILNFAQLVDFQIGGNSPLLGNTITGNGQNGIAIRRTADGSVQNVLIQNNTISGNGSLVNPFTEASGIYLLAANAPKLDTYLIADNNILANINDGIVIDVRADAMIEAQILRNDISNNLVDGIHTIEQVVDATDLRGVTGPWQQNTITNNGGRGIILDAVSGVTDPVTLITSPLLIGSTIDPAFGNEIADNGLDGIEMNAAGDLIIARNLITRNGGAGGFTPANDNGIAAIDLNPLSVANVEIANNDITDNRGDAIEIEGDNFGLTFNIHDNIIDFNDGRGLDLISKPDFPNTQADSSFVEVEFNNNIVNANRMEGVLIVQTNDSTQGQNLQFNTGADNAGYLSGGNAGSVNFLRFNANANTIIGNGIDAEDGSNPFVSATGFVVYVGTTAGNYGFTDPGGFASDGFGNFVDGGIIMNLTNNTLSGNFGSDIFFRSFTSTVDPLTTGGGWAAAAPGFNPQNYRGDPLARLDLTYQNNQVIAADVLNIGAFYNNAEGVFKSRLNNIAAADFPGPFTDAARFRNAQRQGARYNLAPIVSNDGGIFLYPGMGDSTFRVRGNALELNAAGFILDNPSPMTDQFDANGIFRGGNVGNLQMPYGWGTF